ncbi:F0F1 ATP synthase subunit A [Flavimobilis rhizosphaerae]|uniref:F0F1 ATP synthase subunit A n=1 Tax=Flavimobilis rhizosphaerae TaxID=2775421 RepID=UPI002E29FD84|nr:F0F1 ATP synthase subunit A [Flavimobilis rhizosphaerae]
MLAAGDGEGGGFHTPTLADFFPPAIFFEGTPFEFNRITLVRVLATFVLVTVFVLVARRATLVPGRAQGAIELVLDFVRVNIVEEIIGKKTARRHTPLLTIMFLAIFAMNITGIVPALNIAGSGVIGFPIVMAVIAYGAFIIAGVRAQGGLGYLRSALFPPGVPWPIYIILTPIEIISTFVLRPATLAIRLLVNMVAGHLLLVLCFAATHFLFLEAAAAFKAIGVVTLAAGFAFTVFEIFIAILQAYIFVLLTAVYINLSEEAH